MDDYELYFKARRAALDAELIALRTEQRMVTTVYSKKLCDMARKSADIARRVVELNIEMKLFRERQEREMTTE